MGSMKFAIKMLKADFKRSLFYCGSLVISTAIVFVFFNMTANPFYGGSQDMSSSSFSTVLALVVVIIAMILAFFANTYYLHSKTKELAIQAVSGGSVLTLANFLLTQNALIMLIAMPMGLILGYFVNPVINAIVYSYLNIQSNTWVVYPAGWFFTAICLATEMLWLVIIDTGYAYRKEVKDLIEATQAMQKKEKGSIKIPGIVFLVIYFIPIILMLLLEPNADLYLGVCMIGLFGIGGVLNKVLPQWIMKLQNSHYLNHRHKLLSLGNLHQSLKQSTVLVQTIIISVTFLVSFMCVYKNDYRQLVMIIMSYVVLTILLAISIVYKVIIEASLRVKSFSHMRMLGYITKDLKKIIRQEIVDLFGMLIVLPMLYIGIMILRFTTAQLMTAQFGIIIIGFYLLTIMMAGIISYFIYVRLVLKGKR